MKLKTFFAPNVPHAIEEIRDLYGDNAIIISTMRLPNKGVKLIVATEEKTNENDLFNALNDEKLEERMFYFQSLLNSHAIPDIFITRLAQTSLKKNGKTLDEKLLTYSFSELFQFKPIYPILKNTIYVFVGNAGSGKTLTLKKMALQAKKESLKPTIVSLDIKKSGAISDIQNFSQLMKIPCVVVKDLKQLNEVLTLTRLSSDYILVDTPSINPYKEQELDVLKTIKRQLADAEFVLTMAAGLDAQEAVAQGALFSKSGCNLLIATKLDSSIRYYNLLEVLLYNQLSMAAFCLSDKIIDSPIEATAENLTKLFVSPISQEVIV